MITDSLLESLLKMRYTTFRFAFRICCLFVCLLPTVKLCNSGFRERNLVLLSPIMQSLLFSFSQAHDPSTSDYASATGELKRAGMSRAAKSPVLDRYLDCYYISLLNAYISDSITPLFNMGIGADRLSNFLSIFSTLLYKQRKDFCQIDTRSGMFIT